MDRKLYKLMNWPKIEGIIYSEDDTPQDILGAHGTKNAICVQMFRPGAVSAEIQPLDSKKKSIAMELVDEAGYFAALVPVKTMFPYKYVITFPDESTIETYDAYNFKPQITRKDTDKFNSGIHYTVYDCLGAHPRVLDGVEGVSFAVWAPNAVRVSVVGDFNAWDGRIHQMQRLWDSGVFELFVPGAAVGDNYKFELKVKGGLTYLKADPYAFGAQLRPESASVVQKVDNYQWHDHEWIANREKDREQEKPMSVYELHLGSFERPTDGRDFYNYRELAPKIIKYVKDMGYTHIELMPVMEHPLDASWGYQVIGYYAPTSRYGTPEDFMAFMDALHVAGIGVILDWVPAHFPRDVYGLSSFDGTCLYEHMDPRKGFHPHWGTLIYNYARPEVSNYLIANALFWIERYHADGIRMDAVASMLYLDYGKQDGEWVANIYGGNENLEAIEFIKHLNSQIHKRGRGALSIAEESTAWPNITGKLNEDGLGFDYKWNMGWMNDYLDYIKFDPYFRSYHHGELTFSLIYTYSERFMLVLSHDEVVHGKASLLGKMPGEVPEKFNNLRLTYGYMMAHPGKKLLFMGQDIGEFDEWNEERSLEWDLLRYDSHKQLNHFMKDLNHFYQEHPAFYELDNDSDGFEWINSISSNECVIVFLRKTKKEEETLLVVCNFANKCYENYKIGVPFEGKYKEILNSNQEEYGGTGERNPRLKRSSKEECDAREDSIKITVAPLSISVFSCTKLNEEEKSVQKKRKTKVTSRK